MSKYHAVRSTGSLPVRIQSVSSSTSKKDFSPLITTSGYLTKRSRGFGPHRWQKRWWQLLGDGTLIYFRGEERLKVLGEIDIAHTCYDIRLGADQCDINFPSAVSSSCCFAVHVLKRTYYFYAPTSQEAKKWVESLRESSYLLNRSRPRELSSNPAVQVASEVLETTPPSPPSVPPPPSTYKPLPPPPSVPPPLSESTDEGEDEPSDLPGFHNPYYRNHNLSVPDLRYDYYTPNSRWIDGSPRIRQARSRPSSSQSSSSQSYWQRSQSLLGENSHGQQRSSQESPGQRRSFQGSPGQRHSFQESPGQRRSFQESPGQRRSFQESPGQHHSFQEGPEQGHSSLENPGQHRLQRNNTHSRQSAPLPHPYYHNFVQRRPSKEKSGQHYPLKDMSKRSSLTQWYASHSNIRDDNKDHMFSATLPSPGKLSRAKWKSELNTNWVPSFERLEELQQQEEAIRKRLSELKKTEKLSYSHAVPVLPMSPTKNDPPTFPPPLDHPSQSFESEVQASSTLHDISNPLEITQLQKPPKKPPRKAPKPVKRRNTPYIYMHYVDDQEEFDYDENDYENVDENVKPDSPQAPPTSTSQQTSMYWGTSKKSTAIRAHEANMWVKKELNKVSILVKHNGY